MRNQLSDGVDPLPVRYQSLNLRLNQKRSEPLGRRGSVQGYIEPARLQYSKHCRYGLAFLVNKKSNRFLNLTTQVEKRPCDTIRVSIEFAVAQLTGSAFDGEPFGMEKSHPLETIRDGLFKFASIKSDHGPVGHLENSRIIGMRSSLSVPLQP
jgi:hypothetical protein